MLPQILCFVLLAIPAILASLPPFVGDLGAQLLHLAFHPFCHQMPERSLDLWGTEMAVCYRCLGIYWGLPLSLCFGFRTFAAKHLLYFALPLLFDWTFHQLGWWENTPITQFSTGFLLGIGVGFFAARGVFEVILSLLPKVRKRY